MVKLLRHFKKKEGNIFFPLKVVNNLICGRNSYGITSFCPGILTLPQLILMKFKQNIVCKPAIFNQHFLIALLFLTLFIHN